MSTDLQSDLPTLEALDGEFGPDEISSGTSSERRRRLAWLASLVALGLVGAAILAPTLWYVEWPSIAWLFVIPSKEAIGGHVPANLNDQIADLVHERDALQKTINELAAAQERAVDAIVSLEAAGAASQERAPSNQGPSYWYSVPSTLSYPTIWRALTCVDQCREGDIDDLGDQDAILACCDPKATALLPPHATIERALGTTWGWMTLGDDCPYGNY
jgi:hypothetical protein